MPCNFIYFIIYYFIDCLTQLSIVTFGRTKYETGSTATRNAEKVNSETVKVVLDRRGSDSRIELKLFEEGLEYVPSEHKDGEE